MRELLRGESALPATIRIPVTPSNTCVRAVLGSGASIVTALLGDTGVILDVSEAAPITRIGARGPVCLNKGEAARLEVQGTPGVVRYVVWVAP